MDVLQSGMMSFVPHLEPYRTNVLVWRDTKEICDSLPPLPGDATVKVRFDRWAGQPWSPTPTHSTLRTVVPVDTLEAAGLLVRSAHLRPAVLNLADDCFPTGNVDVGSTAQEECLCRCSTLSRHLDMAHYPIKDDELLYSRGVTVLKGPASKGYAWVPERWDVDIISCPGIRHPILTNGHLSEHDTERLLLKIRNIFRTAHAMGNDSLVLGALGCGAWRNPPEDVAAAFLRVCQEHEGMFRRVEFAVLPSDSMEYFAPNHDQRPNKCNYRVFEQVLGPTMPWDMPSEHYYDTARYMTWWM